MKRRLLLAMPALALAGCFSISNETPATFTVTNVGSDTMRAVVVHVTGASYAIGELAPGASRSVDVFAQGDSHVELTSGANPRLTVACYFGPGYSGRISSQVTATRVVAVQTDVRFSAYSA